MHGLSGLLPELNAGRLCLTPVLNSYEKSGWRHPASQFPAARPAGSHHPPASR